MFPRVLLITLNLVFSFLLSLRFEMIGASLVEVKHQLKVNYQPQGQKDKLAIVKDSEYNVSSFSPSSE